MANSQSRFDDLLLLMVVQSLQHPIYFPILHYCYGCSCFDSLPVNMVLVVPKAGCCGLMLLHCILVFSQAFLQDYASFSNVNTLPILA